MAFPPIIGLCGAIGSGKDTCATFLSSVFLYTNWAFADPVYEGVWRLNPPVPLGPNKYIYLQQLVEEIGWDTAKRRYPIIRQWLRVQGTENGRDIHGDDCWIEYMEHRLPLFGEWGNQRFVLRDVRFPNEADMVYRYGGEIWQIVGRVSPEMASLPKHRSEGQQFEITRTISNDSTIAVFQRRITTIMEGFLA